MGQTTRLVAVDGSELVTEKPFEESKFVDGKREILVIYEVENTSQFTLVPKISKLVDSRDQELFLSSIVEVLTRENLLIAVTKQIMLKLKGLVEQQEEARTIREAQKKASGQ